MDQEPSTDRLIIGNGLAYSGAAFIVFGFLAFLNSGYMAIGNILLIIGLIVLLGPLGFIQLFSSRDIRSIGGTVAYVVGVLLILFKLGFIGIFIELVGLWLLFWPRVPQIILHTTSTLPGGRILRSVPWIARQAEAGVQGPILSS
ncbi:hypothetical protein BLNAU_8966 [Blattamonas nauphoetae]|uniref:Uncharacterized protein n=1 Tax=Blattamonas nauphoetae TaxID=2049346 RepID=A0ABQ9XWY6_9EUKA|nr:hypothetical protein BLNAU_8966 [Blattamonas nauphoetae]